ncbi:MAG: CCA tRNA nucleotidyltransferase [Actinobacteria bacterium]|nr:CCA tRNA nucleotidyltransferase [Actinomycetota bacterium]NBP17167.1 CCA tRNA nucleotidyltransferase [Actinomycetota bacterium]NBR92202.1 CCA tRNA nucleotidyltransferase [Actinomycetota bacterium]NCY09318.1 CCA tRNA nucleotidyltransferase [Actinomycetota bacterium]NDE67200.1 CCA tRNA nucleotidyltransferase [Actinomycetota bacterium]
MQPARFDAVIAELTPITTAFRAAGHRLYIVGGTVRDLLLGRDTTQLDFDFTTDARPDQVKTLLGGLVDSLWTQGERFGTIAALRGSRSLEITTHRAEAYDPDSRKPEVKFSDSIDTDLARRDFTFNAMALELTAETPQLVDPYGGLDDLMARRLRTPLSPEESFSDDPLRMLRAARFIATLSVTPDEPLVRAVRAMNERLNIVSPERVRDEFDRMMTTDAPTLGLRFSVECGLADRFLPELSALSLEQDPIHRHKDVLTHTFAVVENVRREMPGDFRIVRLAALYHDIGKPRTRKVLPGKGMTFYHHEVVGAKMTRKRMRELHYSNDDIRKVSELVFLSGRFHTYQMGWTDSAVRRYVRDAGDVLTELNVLVRCDCTTRSERKVDALNRRMDELEARINELAAKEELAALRPELDGLAVMQHLGIEPGPAVGEAMDFLMEIRLDEGLLGDVAIRARLDAWWSARQQA